ncbi:MAG: hypothetical protein HYR56_15395 [Acidobacteria bacterium]|nr:hypothetical protein [Acidobacteriota bacterium]MBI3422129.1 hypothetical protein [Acidobacteriota bacterium]
MNYFNYFTEVENEFVKRRGSHMLVSPLDWALIESWKQRGVPLHIVLRGINTSFDGYDKRAQRGRKVNSLLFCQQEIEAQYLDYCETRVGSNTTVTSENGATNGHHGNGNGKKSAADSPFAKARLVEFLSEHYELLENLRARNAHDWPLAETFARTAARLQQLLDDVKMAAHPDTEGLERDLTSVEELILTGLKQSISADALAEIEADAKRQLRTYREKMGKEIYEQTRANYGARRLRELYQVPRLSLFYL